MCLQLFSRTRALLRTADIYRECLIASLMVVSVACTNPPARDTEDPGLSPQLISEDDKAITTNKPPSPKIESKAAEPLIENSAPLPADQDSATVTEPPPQTAVTTTPKSQSSAPVESATQKVKSTDSAAAQSANPEFPPKKNVVVRERLNKQKTASSIRGRPVIVPETKPVKTLPKPAESRKELTHTEAVKKEQAKPEVKARRELSVTEDKSIVAMRDESTIDLPILSEKPAAIAAELPSVTLESLPMTFGTHWRLDHVPNPINGKTECILTSNAVNIFDGYGQTDVQLYLTSGSIFAKTVSNIDLSYPETGLRVDNSELRHFEKVAKLTNAVISSDVAGVLASMAPGRQVAVRLGFWPTWPVTSTREVVFGLEGFPEALRALRACEAM